MIKTYLYQLTKELKLFIAIFLITITVGVSLGLVFLYQTTSFSKNTTVERLADGKKDVEEDFGISESKSRSTGELLMTTHNHILGFAFIFFFVGTIFYFNSTISGPWKIILLTEPFISILLSFGSMWGVRLIGQEIIYITILSAILMYSSFFVMVGISLFELLLKSPS